jgi:predicted TIM-barrel fold metal-dependent hydrolase
MKTMIIAKLLLISFIIHCVGQNNTKNLPVIDMHVHVYSPQNYWGGFDFPVVDTTLSSPADQEAHLEALILQIKKYNIVKTYASGNFKALDIINELYPDLFLPSAEIWPTADLLKDTDFLNTLEQKIKSGEIRSIGEVANFYTGIAPNDPVMDTLYQIAIKYDLPIGLHFAPGPPGSQFRQYPNMRLEYSNPYLLQDVLLKFPKLRLYIMHAGLPMFMEETFAMMMMYPNLYVDISAVAWYNKYCILVLDEFLERAC